MNMSKTPAGSTIDPSILKQAETTWRRAAVRRNDRRAMAQELTNELTAAAQAGLAPTAVTGDDAVATLRAWADERGVTGRARRYGTLISATLVGIAAGMGLLFAILALAFANTFTIEPYAVVFGIYLASGALAYLLALAAAWAVLTALGDPCRQQTVSSLAALLPFGALGSVAVGVAIAWGAGFTTRPSTFIAVIVGVCSVLAATVALARFRSIDGRLKDRGRADALGY